MSQMDHFEDDLRNALRREQPSEGFEARVLARAAAEPVPSKTSWFQMPVLRFAMAAALCLVFVVSVRLEEGRHERAKGEAAKQQVMLALRVTGNQLHAVSEKVRGLSSDYSSRQ
jgi:hypothetical protein